MGRVSEEKRPFDFIDLIEFVAPRMPGVRGDWLGDGHLRPRVIEEVKRRGFRDRIRFEGESEGIPERMAGSDVLVHFRLDEAFGLVIAEAQAAERSVNHE